MEAENSDRTDSQNLNPIVPFQFDECVPNFRQVWPTCQNQDVYGSKGLLFRSSRLDFLDDNGIQTFKKMGVKTIIDMRAASEYRKSNPEVKEIDSYFNLHRVCYPLTRFKFKENEKVSTVEVKSTFDDKFQGRHLCLNFFRANYIGAIFTRAPIWFRFYSMIYLFMDLILWTQYYANWVGVFAEKVLNPTGLIGQYKDFITHAQTSIAAAIKLIAEPENLPVVINCAHGKDRTGVLVALILSICGVSREYIAWDYSLSKNGLKDIMDRVRQETVLRYSMSENFTTAEPETILKALEFVDEQYGSVPEYLKHIGVSYEEQERIRHILMKKNN